MKLRTRALLSIGAGVVLATGIAVAPAGAAANVRVTNDTAAGTYQYSGGDGPYTDVTLQTCSADRDRQNEPAVEADPRSPSLLLASSNDYCPSQVPPSQSIWLGYYRSEDGGRSWTDSLVPGYPGDSSPASKRAQVDAADSGDPVIAWDNYGNAYFGAEASGVKADPFSKKTNGDIWVARYQNPLGDGGPVARDASLFSYSRTIANGSQAPNLLGKFNDKTAIEVDRTGGRCDGTVYFAYSRFTGNGVPGIFFTRSTDRGNTWSQPQYISQTQKDVQFADISVTHDGNVTVTWRQIESHRAGETDAVVYNVSQDCGKTFPNQPQFLANFIHYDEQDVPGGSSGKPVDGVRDEAGTPEAGTGSARDCGDGRDACKSGYTFFRQDSQVRSTADQQDPSNTVFVVYNATKPGTETATGTTYGTIVSGTGSQSGVYFTTIKNGAGQGDGTLVDPEARGHQFFPDLAARGGKLHVIWWDSRNDPSYSTTLPPGNTASGTNSGPALDVFGTVKAYNASNFQTATPVTNVGTNGNWEQFDARRVPFAGDYLWVTAVDDNTAYVVWTDWRDTRPGVDPRPFETGEPAAEGFDVFQCRTSTNNFATDSCPAAGGKDQNIYGDNAP